MNYLEAGIPVVTQEAQEVLALDENHLRGVKGLCGNLVGLTRQRGTQTENFTRAGYPEHQALAVFRANREFRASIAKNEDATRLPAFREQSSAPGKQTNALDGVEGLQ
jgi:hypothetical protein